MEKPTLFVKKGCPYCHAATAALDERGVAYKEWEVRGDPAGMKELARISGQQKTPTLLWDGDVLANFGVEELDPFLARHQQG